MTQTDEPPAGPQTDPPPGRRERPWPWVAALVAAGMLLSALPHLVEAARDGDPSYIADGDGLLYLAWSRDMVLNGGPAMTDAVHRPSGPMMHPWILFVPAARLAHALGLGMTGLGVLWRLVAGAGLALGLYAAARPFTATARGAAGLAAFLLFDAGFLFGQILQRDGELLVAMARGSPAFLQGAARVMPHLRVPTPAIAIPFLIGHFAIAHRARATGTTASAVAAGLSLGLLFHVYFYFATTVALGTVLAWILDRGGRRTYGLMLVVGAIVAVPAVVAGARIKASTPPDWLLRTDKFVPVSRFDRDHLLVAKVLILEWLMVAPFALRGRRELLYLWACAGAGFALVNQQIVTGRELENFHWTYAYGVAMSLLVPALVLPWASRLGGWRRIAPAIVAAQVVLGFGFRAVETTRVTETAYYRAIRDRWRGDGPAIPPGSVVAGPTEVLFTVSAIEDVDPLDCRLIEFSSLLTDEARDERLALNLVLAGISGPAAEAEIKVAKPNTEASLSRRRGLFERISREPDLAARLDRFGVTHILLPAGGRPPAALEGRATRAATGKFLDLWWIDRRRATPGG